MKVKLKLDVASIKAWLLEHGEKLAFGLMVLVFLLFTYSALRREVLPDAQQPDMLQAKAEDVERHVNDSKWDEQREGVQVIDYRTRVAREPVATAAFVLKVPFNAPLADPKSKREVPKLINAEELRVAAGYGVFALSSEAAGAKPAAQPVPIQGRGGAGQPRPKATQTGRSAGTGFKPKPTAKLKGQPWAAIIGLVPIEKQRQEYARAFEHCMGADPARDAPHYEYAPNVQRAEIDEAHPDQLNWQDLPWSNIKENERAWEGDGQEIVASAYLDSVLTGRLGPLVGVAWGESVAHPKVPLASEGDNPPPPMQPVVEKEKAPEPIQEKDGGAFHKIQREKQAVAPPTASTEGQAAPATVKYRLLRVFDYSVEPNKKYRYRLMLAAANPNYKVLPQFLQNPDSAKPEGIQTDDWTAPTDAVTIPNGYGVLAGGIEQPNKGEPAAKLLLTAIDKQEGIEAATEKLVQRGTIANLTKDVVAVDPRNDQSKDMSDVDFKTDMVVLDIYGGRALSKKKNPINAPIEVLLLDAHGNLTVRNELDDHVEYEHRKPPAETDARPADPIPRDDVKPFKKKPRAR
jgi:hypothetical protein